MNQQQRKSVKERARNIYKRRLNALREKHTKPGKELTPEQRASLVRQGKVKLKSSCKSISRYSDALTDIFDFSKYEYKPKLDEVKFNKERDTLGSEYNLLLNEIMLGDEREAMELLRKFDA